MVNKVFKRSAHTVTYLSNNVQIVNGYCRAIYSFQKDVKPTKLIVVIQGSISSSSILKGVRSVNSIFRHTAMNFIENRLLGLVI